MKFSPPVIAAISAGSLAILALITILVLYVRGFFDQPEPEKPADPKTNTERSHSELIKAVENARPYLKNKIICDALLAANFEGEDIKKAIAEWSKMEQRKIKEKAEVEAIIDAFTESFKAMVQRVKDCGSDEVCLKEAVKKALGLYKPLCDLTAFAKEIYNLKCFFFFGDNSDKYLKGCDDDEKLRIGKKIVTAFKYIIELDYLDPMNADEKKERYKGYLDEIEETFKKY